MDAFEILAQSHDQAKSTFRQLEQASPDQRGAIWAKLRPELTAHEKIEEQYVYDPAVQDVGQRDPMVSEFHQRHEQQVQQATRLMEQIGDLDPRDSRFLDLVLALNQALAQHIQMEETEFWPLLRRTWGEEQLQQAGGKVQTAKTAAEAGAGVSGALGTVGEAIKNIGR